MKQERGGEKKKNGVGRTGKWDKHKKTRSRGWKQAEESEKEKKKKQTQVRKMENLSSLGSQQSAELNLTRKMTLHPLSHQSD